MSIAARLIARAQALAIDTHPFAAVATEWLIRRGLLAYDPDSALWFCATKDDFSDAQVAVWLMPVVRQSELLTVTAPAA